MKKAKITAFVLAAAVMLTALPAFARVQAAESVCENVKEPAAETAYTARDYSKALADTLEQLALNVPEPEFGTNSGEWTVLALARGGYFGTGDAYFKNYYDRITKTVRELSDKVGMNGALDKKKSTENSRLILALSAIGRDASNVGGVDLIAAYSRNDFDKWLSYQGINGPIFALIALDTWDYQTEDTGLRDKCVKYILDHELSGGGWSLTGTGSADPDITGMALQALANYKNKPDVGAAADRAFGYLSSNQLTDGGFASWDSVNAESVAQVIVACTAWGIDPNTDKRFVKSGGSAVDALLRFYVEKDRGFAHVIVDSPGYVGGQVNAMATDQAAYALVAYDRFLKGLSPLYDMGDTKPGRTNDGDVNCNGFVDAQDALMALRASMGLLKLSGEQITRGDIDGSGSVDMSDALDILRISLGVLAL